METTVRELPEAEWDRFNDKLVELDIPPLNPAPGSVRIVVAEDTTGAIVGWQLVAQVVHLEPIWIHPAVRSKTVAYRMWKAATAVLDECHVKAAFCFADTPEVEDYLTRLGLQPCRDFKIFLYDAERESALCPSPQSLVPEPPSARRG